MHGARGEDPTEPPSSAPYPFPPASDEPRIQRLFDDIVAIGLHPFHAPCAVMLDEAGRACGPMRPGRKPATAVACLVHARSDAEVIGVRPALKHSNVTLVRNAEVRRLTTDDSGRTVTSVVADVDGAEQRFAGEIVVVCAGAANTAKLLLSSANDRHPRGLANGSDQVGRHYMFHNTRAFLAIAVEPDDTRFQKTLAVFDYYFGDDAFAFPMGNLQLTG